MFLDTEPSPQPPRINRFLITVLQQFGLQLNSTLSSFPSFSFFSNCDEAPQPLLAWVSLYSPQTPRERLIYAAYCTSVLIIFFSDQYFDVFSAAKQRVLSSPFKCSQKFPYAKTVFICSLPAWYYCTTWTAGSCCGYVAIRSIFEYIPFSFNLPSVKYCKFLYIFLTILMISSISGLLYFSFP